MMTMFPSSSDDEVELHLRNKISYDDLSSM